MLAHQRCKIGMACPKHQLMLHLLLVMELLLQLQKTRVLKALLHLEVKDLVRAFQDLARSSVST